MSKDNWKVTEAFKNHPLIKESAHICFTCKYDDLIPHKKCTNCTSKYN